MAFRFTPIVLADDDYAAQRQQAQDQAWKDWQDREQAQQQFFDELQRQADQQAYYDQQQAAVKQQEADWQAREQAQQQWFEEQQRQAEAAAQTARGE